MAEMALKIPVTGETVFSSHHYGYSSKSWNKKTC